MYRLTELFCLQRPLRFPGPARAWSVFLVLLLAGCATTPVPVAPAPRPEPPPPVAIVEPAPAVPVSLPGEPAVEPPPEVVTVEPEPDQGDLMAAELVGFLGSRLGLDSENLVVVEVAESLWPNACLGFPADGEICAEVLTPGYAITLEVDGLNYSFRTDETMERLRLVAAPLPDIGSIVAVWKDTRSSFATATVGSRGFSVGLRGGPQLTVPFGSADRDVAMAELLARFAPFQALTEAGEIEFHGKGQEVAGEVEQRMVAEWIQGTYQSVWIDGTPDTPATVLTWKRIGGIAGFCDIVAINAGGEVIVNNCRGDGTRRLARSWLDHRQLIELYGWIDTLESFESDQTEPAVSDALTISIMLRGDGLKKVDEAVLAAIHRLASDLFLQGYEQANNP